MEIKKWYVEDVFTSGRVTGFFETWQQATKKADKLNLAYGAHRYNVRLAVRIDEKIAAKYNLDKVN